MPKSKNRKDHKKKVASRRTRIEQEKNKFQKLQKEMLMKLIEQEKQKGMFENNPIIPTLPNLESPLQGTDAGPII
jgi:hypothetical protein